MEHQQTTHNTSREQLVKLHDELAQAWGIDFQRVRLLLCLLCNGDWHTTSDLIAASSISHWNITHLLQQLDPWLEQEEQRVRIKPEYHDMAATIFDCAHVSPASFLASYEIAAKAGERAAQAEALVTSMRQLVQQFPGGRNRHLDHIAATPLTCVKRALFLAGNYTLEGASVLFLGDHDFTSLALAQVISDIAITVVDVDEQVLRYISAVSVRHGWNIRTVFADFRVELPRSLHESCDLAFTDPPYTPEGIGLFLARGIESLKPADYARLLFCYGFSERRPALGFKVQSVLYDLRLVSEAILPHFNRYSGAEAIASSAALYICRPTRRSVPAAEAQKVDPRIYTHGKNAEEAQIEHLPDHIVGKARAYMADYADDEALLVGDGWPGDMLSRVETTSLLQYPKADRSKTGTMSLPARTVYEGKPKRSSVFALGGYLRTMYTQQGAQGKPPFTRPPHAGVVAVNLSPHYDAYLARLLLTSAADHLLIVATEDAARALFDGQKEDALKTLIACKYRIATREQGSSSRPAILTFNQVTADDLEGVNVVLRYIIDRRYAKLVNAWREGLIACYARQGQTIAKNQARQAIEQSRLAAIHATGYLSELSLDDLRKLVSEVTATFTKLV
ncbi:MAG: bis-aminopropyl spermidine synthase family protein [Ktedonobacteraceae bacterium]